MEEKKDFKTVDKMRRIINWCDFQRDDFIAKFQTIGEIEKCYDACHKHGITFADSLVWDDKDPNLVNDPQYLLAKEVNGILGRYIYPVGELTFPMITQAKKDFLELLNQVEELSFCKNYVKFKGYNRDGVEQFDYNYKSITARVVKTSDTMCSLLPSVEIWDDNHILKFKESFDELLYGNGFGCTVVGDEFFTREVDVRDVLGLPGHKFHVGSYGLRDYLEENPDEKKFLEEVESTPKLYVPDDVFDGGYFTLVEKIRLILFVAYEDMMVCDGNELIEDFDFYTGKRVMDVNEITEDDWKVFMDNVEESGIKWREFIQRRMF